MFLITTNNPTDSSCLLKTRYSITTGKTKANEVEQTAPIKLIKRPKLGTRRATENVARTIKALKIISQISGCRSATLNLFMIDGNIISIGM